MRAMSLTADQREVTQAEQQTRSVPRHIAIIMDGNGRWATARGLPRGEGHRRGVEAVRQTVRAAIEQGVRLLTLYSFSSENWSRPPEEIDFLFGLFRLFVRRDVDALDREGVRISIIGNREGLPSDMLAMIEDAEKRTAQNRTLHLVIAFNYGARNEIARATRAIAEEVKAGKLDPADITETTVTEHLDTARLPDPDLVIRTGREIRLSNFLLWQSAYAELIFLEMNWPDFGREALIEAIDTFSGRNRRFGGRGPRESA